MRYFIWLITFIWSCHAYTYHLDHAQWNLLGSPENTSTMSFKRSCITEVWAYDEGIWSGYQPGAENNSLESIARGQGFWLKNSSACDITTISGDQATLDEDTATAMASTLIDQINLYQLGLDNADYASGDHKGQLSSEGSCGGSADVSIDGSLQDQTVSLTTTYGDYCSDVIQADGSLTATAMFETLKLKTLLLYAQNFTTQTGTIDGSLKYTFENYTYTDLSGLAFTMELDTFITPADSDVSYYFDDVVFDFAHYEPDTLSMDLAISGTMASSDKGSVTVSTLERVVLEELAPVSGEIKLSGDSKTQAVCFVQEGTWYIKIDINGDDNYDITKPLSEAVGG